MPGFSHVSGQPAAWFPFGLIPSAALINCDQSGRADVLDVASVTLLKQPLKKTVTALASLAQ